jgi:hypothetical protein
MPNGEKVFEYFHARRAEVILSALSGFTKQQSRRSLLIKMNKELLEPHTKLIKIEILGRCVAVPENNRLLRCFQFLSLKTISYGDFCWNGECTNCEIWYHNAGQSEANDQPALACRLTVSENMIITRLNRCLELEGINKIKDEE